MISEILKAETASCHDAIENARRFVRLGSPDFSQDEYVELLARLYGFYKPLERAFREQSELMTALAYQGRFKLPLLAEDLTYLGYDAARLEALPQCADLPPTTTLPQTLGCIYVMEGSTHGAQFLAKRLQAQLHLDEAGLRYYRGYGSETSNQWKAFKQYLDNAIQSEADAATVVQAATQTFQALHRWMDADTAA